MTATTQRPRPADVRALYASSFTHGYDTRAACWDRTLAWRARAQIRDRLRRLPARPLVVLDVGCGTGRTLSLLQSIGVQVESYRGVDRSLRMLSKVESDAMRPGCSVDVVDLDTATPFWSNADAGTYDLEMCTWVLSHLQRPDQLLDAMLAAAAKEGRVLIAALTQTTRPVGTLIARRYRRLHAWPIDGQIVHDRQPHFTGTGLHGLTTVAEWVGSGVAFSDRSNIVS